ncbi:MAG: hypothetical protein ACP5KN_16055 [Armatimonadota bacterium]
MEVSPLRLLTACYLSVMVAAPAGGAWYDVTAGPVEMRLSETRVERILVRDRYVFGDQREYRGPAVAPELLDDQWSSVLAEGDRRAPELLEQDAERATVRLAGTLRGTQGGVWPWHMDLTLFAEGRILVEYMVRQDKAPAEPPAYHRLAFTYPFEQALGPGRRPEHVHEPGRPVTVTDRVGESRTVPFGAEPNTISAPATIALPWDGQQVTMQLGDSVSRVELWQGGWAQRINLFLPPATDEVTARVEIDLGPLARRSLMPVSLHETPDHLDRWRAHPPERLPEPERVLRMVQSLPAYREMTDEEMDQHCRELAPHFDVVQLHWAYWPWRYLQAREDEQAREYLDGKIRLIQRWVDACRRAGLEAALSVNWSPPVANPKELRDRPELQAERFEPETGEFVKVEEAFDWGNAEAAELAADALRDIAGRITGLTYQWFDEPTYRLHTWHQAPFFSEACLEDYRRFTGDPAALFPAKPYAVATGRTDNGATREDWDSWRRWVASVYTRMIRGWVEAVEQANAAIPDYKGAIWFQHHQWWGPDYGIDLDRIFAIPGITWVVCEYCTNAEDPNLKAFRHYAIRHGKRLSTFVNVGWYDASQPGRVRYQGTLEDYRRALEFCFAQNAGAITAYPSWSFYTFGDAYNPDRVRIWDEVMSAHGAGR